MKTTNKILIPFFAAAIALGSCGKKGTVKGSDLKDQDAVEYLAGEEKKCWKLETGHDYYEYLQFYTKDGNVAYQNGTLIKYQVSGSDLTIKDFQDFNYSIIEIGNDKLVMAMAGHDTLTYVKTDEKVETNKTLGKTIDPKWLKGKFGTVWKFDGSDKVYSYMNDGIIIDSKTLQKVDTWSIQDNILNFGPTKLKILRLGAVFFDYDVYGLTIKLNYVCEAKKDGAPVKSL